MNMASIGQNGNADLRDLIREIVKDKGPVSFKDFIELALYHPEFGFYMTSPGPVGPSGDFITAPELHPIFSRTIALRAVNIWEQLGRPDDFDIVEFGAGSGSMAEGILSEIKTHHPGLFRCLSYTIVEVSPYLMKTQQNRLACFNSKLGWIPGLDRLEPVDHGLVIANEVLDALPVHVITKDDGIIKEIFIDTDNGDFKEMLLEPRTSKILKYLEDGNIMLAEGQKAEVNLDAVAWLEDISDSLRNGNIIVIDYGYLAEELFSPKHMSGTLICYYRHQICDDPFANLGMQDITTHVDFSALIRTAAKTGLDVGCFCNQGKYLLDNGILDLLQSYEHSTKESIVARNAVKTLIMPDQMGNIFKVLELQSRS